MADCTADTVENMVSMMTDLTKTIEELNATIAALQTSIQSLKEDNALLLEENKYLKRKLFGSKSEKYLQQIHNSFLFLMNQKINAKKSFLKKSHILETRNVSKEKNN